MHATQQIPTPADVAAQHEARLRREARRRRAEEEREAAAGFAAAYPAPH